MRGSSFFPRIKSELLGQDTWELTRPPPHSFRRGSRAWPSVPPHASLSAIVGIVSALTSLCVRHPEFFLSHRQRWQLFLSLYDCCCLLFSWAPLLCPSSPSVSATSLYLLWSCFLRLTQSHPSCPSSCCCSLLFQLSPLKYFSCPPSPPTLFQPFISA